MVQEFSGAFISISSGFMARARKIATLCFWLFVELYRRFDDLAKHGQMGEEVLVPCSNGSRPPRASKRVVLPLPDGPMVLPSPEMVIIALRFYLLDVKL